jgi:ABC-type glycerol-3-phosphate transport system permease component
MLSRGLEYLGTELEGFLQGWNAFDRVGIPLYRVGMLSTGLVCFLQDWNAFYRIGMLSTGLEYFRHSWNTIVKCGNAF